MQNHLPFPKVYYFKNADQNFLVQLSRVSTHHLFAPQEEINSSQHEMKLILIVNRGLVGRAGRVLSHQDIFGEDFILANPDLREPKLSTALTYVEVVMTRREELFTLLHS